MATPAFCGFRTGEAIPSHLTLDLGFPPTKVKVLEHTKGKKVILMGLPGAFTPTWYVFVPCISCAVDLYCIVSDVYCLSVRFIIIRPVLFPFLSLSLSLSFIFFLSLSLSSLFFNCILYMYVITRSARQIPGYLKAQDGKKEFQQK